MHCSDDEHRLLKAPANPLSSITCFRFKTLMDKQCKQTPNCTAALLHQQGVGKYIELNFLGANAPHSPTVIHNDILSKILPSIKLVTHQPSLQFRGF